MVNEPELFAAATALAAKKNAPVQLGTRTRAEIDLARQAARESNGRTLIAGILTPGADTAASLRMFVEAGVDLVQVTGARSTEQLAEIARVVGPSKVPFALDIPVDLPLAEAIETLDASPQTRPWHYLVEATSLLDVSAALSSLFRAAPPLAHRVVGVDVIAGESDPSVFSDEMYELLTTFGLTFAGVHTSGDPRFMHGLAR